MKNIKKNKKLYIVELLLFISIIVFNIFYKNDLFMDGSIVVITIVSLLL